MRRPFLLSLLMLPLVAACQLGLPKDGAAPPAPPVAEEIAVTPLDAPAADATPADAGTPASAAASEVKLDGATSVADTAPQMSEADLAKSAPALPPEDSEGALEAAAAAAAAPPPEPVKSPTQIACEKKGGHFSVTGTNGTLACVFQTRDAGKRCRKAGDCQGICLARSMTCSPFTPVFGCQDILQQDGKRVTECVE